MVNQQIPQILAQLEKQLNGHGGLDSKILLVVTLEGCIVRFAVVVHGRPRYQSVHTSAVLAGCSQLLDLWRGQMSVANVYIERMGEVQLLKELVEQLLDLFFQAQAMELVDVVQDRIHTGIESLLEVAVSTCAPKYTWMFKQPQVEHSKKSGNLLWAKGRLCYSCFSNLGCGG